MAIDRQYSNTTAKSSYEFASLLALGSQLPDMVPEWDAFDNWSEEVGGGPGRDTNWEEAYAVLHALDPKGDGSASWTTRVRRETRTIIGDALKAGDVALAGLAIHRLADSYAHTYRDDNGNWVSFGGFDGHSPNKYVDNIYGSQTRRIGHIKVGGREITDGGAHTIIDYVKDLSGILANAFTIKGSASYIRDNAVKEFTAIYNNFNKPGGRNESDFITRARAYETRDYVDSWRNVRRPLLSGSMSASKENATHAEPNGHYDAYNRLLEKIKVRN